MAKSKYEQIELEREAIQRYREKEWQRNYLVWEYFSQFVHPFNLQSTRSDN